MRAQSTPELLRVLREVDDPIAVVEPLGDKRQDNGVCVLGTVEEGADVPGTRSQHELTRPYLDQYLTKGYMNASMELEYNSADFAIAQMILQSTGNQALYQRYLKRAQYWKNLYNPQRGWLQSRNPDGSRNLVGPRHF